MPPTRALSPDARFERAGLRAPLAGVTFGHSPNAVHCGKAAGNDGGGK